MQVEFINRLMHVFWRFSRGQTVEIRILARNAAGSVFLTSSARDGWQLPGAALEAGQSAAGLIAGALAQHGLSAASLPARLSGLHRGAPNADHVALYEVAVEAPFTPGSGRFFARDALPENMPPAMRRLIADAAR